jgi:hypothetical protein
VRRILALRMLQKSESREEEEEEDGVRKVMRTAPRISTFLMMVLGESVQSRSGILL